MPAGCRPTSAARRSWPRPPRSCGATAAPSPPARSRLRPRSRKAPCSTSSPTRTPSSTPSSRSSSGPTTCWPSSRPWTPPRTSAPGVVAIVEVLRRRLGSVFELMTAVGMTRPPGPPAPPVDDPRRPARRHRGQARPAGGPAALLTRGDRHAHPTAHLRRHPSRRSPTTSRWRLNASPTSCSTGSPTPPPGPLEAPRADRAAQERPPAVLARPGRRRRAPALRHPGRALPAQPERRHHRQRRGPGRHELHPAGRRDDARGHAACRSSARSPPSTSARGPRWASAATPAPRSSTGSARSRPAR